MRSTRWASVRLPCAAALVAAVACGTAERSAADETPSAGLATVLDSTTNADTTVARTAGMVPAEYARSVVEEMRVAPQADDTSLFGEVYEFDVGRDGRVWVYDQSAHSIFLFDAYGALKRRIGRAGSGPGEFLGNNGMIVLADGRLAQWDPQNARISFFSEEGEFINVWPVASGMFSGHALRTDPSGALYLQLPVTAPRDGEILGRFGLIRIDEGGVFADSLVPPDLPVDRITYTASTSSGSSSLAPTHSPRLHFEWHPRGYFVTATGGNYRIELSRPADQGGPLRIVREGTTVAVPPEERAWDQERITHQLRTRVPSWTWTGPAIPEFKPPLADIEIGRDGTIWARVATESERIPEAELEPQASNGRPRRIFRDPVVYELFDSEGRFRGRVALPLNSTFMQADGSTVWYLHRDADGLPAVVRARVTPPL